MSVFKINESFKKTSLGTLLNLIDSIPKCDFRILIAENYDWEPHYMNSVAIAEIPLKKEINIKDGKI